MIFLPKGKFYTTSIIVTLKDLLSSQWDQYDEIAEISLFRLAQTGKMIYNELERRMHRWG